MKIIISILLSLIATNVLADTSHPPAPGVGKSAPQAAHAMQTPPSSKPEQTVVLTLSSLRRIVTTQCQAMMATRDAQQALADVMRAPSK